MNDNIQRVREIFPDKNTHIDLLIEKDPEFLTMCEDYNICVDALQYWEQSKEPEAKTRVDEYRTLVRELQDEIAEKLTTVTESGKL